MATADSTSPDTEITHIISRGIYKGRYRAVCSCGGFRRTIPRKNVGLRRLQDRAIAKHLAAADACAPAETVRMLCAVAIESGLVEAAE
jgi:hypothetical protein